MIVGYGVVKWVLVRCVVVVSLVDFFLTMFLIYRFYILCGLSRDVVSDAALLLRAALECEETGRTARLNLDDVTLCGRTYVAV